MKTLGNLIFITLLAVLSSTAASQSSDSSAGGRLWGNSTRVQPAVQPYIPPTQPAAPPNTMFSWGGDVCGGYLFGPPGASVNLIANDASGCNSNGGCNVWKTIPNRGALGTGSSGNGSGGNVWAYHNGQLVAYWKTSSSCGLNSQN